jgi:hypothetical protein
MDISHPKRFEHISIQRLHMFEQFETNLIAGILSPSHCISAKQAITGFILKGDRKQSAGKLLHHFSLSTRPFSVRAE